MTKNEAILKIFDEFINMTDEEFEKEIRKHENSPLVDGMMELQDFQIWLNEGKGP